MTNKWLHRTLIMALAVAFVLPACSSSDDPVIVDESAGAPSLPKMSTMTFDLDFFSTSSVSPEVILDNKYDPRALSQGTGKDNWIEAVVRVIYVELSIYAALEAPVGAFAAAANSIPQKQEDGSYLWTFIFVEGNIDYSIFLYGKREADNIAWRMEVSSNDPALTLDHFVWFDGQAALDDKSGYWQFYEPILSPPASPTPGTEIVRMDWANPIPTNESLTILVNGVGHPDEGDTIAFSESTTQGTLFYNDVDVQELHTMTWYPDGSGSIEVPDYNGGVIACWDTQQNDAVCP